MTTAAQQADPDTGEIAMSQQDFVLLLRQLNFGAVAEKLNDMHAECLRESKRLNRAASLTLSVTYKPGKNEQCEVYPKVTNTVPKEEMGADILYFGDKGLQREHPKQREITGLRAVDAENRGPARVAEVAEPVAARSVV